ncbi:MAG: hypothetical protein FWC40_09400 [Proteobacteria bacterium]|nr:hypothetical protein [Pseudomonadota bacterium]
MNRLFLIVTNPVLRAVMLALTGGFLVFFLCIHITGNYLFFGGAEIYNAYSSFLLGLPVIYAIEAVLVTCILYHAIVGLWQKLRRSRARGYSVQRNAPGSRRNLAARYAHISGIVIAVFLVIHVATMKFGEPGIPGPERDMWGYTLVMFSRGWVVALYVLALTVVGLHLFHGLGTLYESLGIAHRTWLRRTGQGVAIMLGIAYVAFPVLVYVFGGSL